MSQSYATRDEFYRMGLRASAVAGISTTDLDAAILDASSEADGYLSSRYALPLTSWDSSLRKAVSAIAAWNILSAMIGFSPEDETAQILRDRYTDALKWLADVAAGRIDPAIEGAAAAASPEVTRSIVVTSAPLRGW